MKQSGVTRLLFIANQFPPQPGGVARAAARNIAYLGNYPAEYQLSLLNITSMLPPGQLACENSGNIKIYRLGAAKRTAETLRLAAALIEDLHAEAEFDIFVGFYLVYAGYLAAYYGRRFSRPAFVSVRGNDLDRALFAPEQFAFVEWTLKHATLVGCVTRALAAQATALTGRDDILYMPNSVDADFWQPAPRDETLMGELGLKGALTLGFVGELREKKAPAALLNGFAAIHKHYPTRLLLIGGARGGGELALKEFAAAAPALHADIISIGYLDSLSELRRYYSLIDIALFTSLWEGMSNALLEAMAMARVVLATSVGGNSEVIEDEKSGFLIPRYQLDQLGERLLRLLIEPADRLEAVALTARQRMVSDFSIEKERQTLLAALSSLRR